MDQKECSRIENICASENTSANDCALAQEDCWGNTPEGLSTGRVDGFARLGGIQPAKLDFESVAIDLVNFIKTVL
jgi:hypothetical protein